MKNCLQKALFKNKYFILATLFVLAVSCREDKEKKQVATSDISSEFSATTNLKGQVFGSVLSNNNTSSESSADSQGSLHVTEDLKKDCSVRVYNVDGTVELTNGITDHEGIFSVASNVLKNNTSYKVVVVCPDDTHYAAILVADDLHSETKTPTIIDPVSTLIAVEVIKTLAVSIQEATANLPSTERTKFVNSFLNPTYVSNIVKTVTLSIQKAISEGTMKAPSDSIATNMTKSIEMVVPSAGNAVLQATRAEEYYTSAKEGNTIPESVTEPIQEAISESIIPSETGDKAAEQEPAAQAEAEAKAAAEQAAAQAEAKAAAAKENKKANK